MSEASQVTKDKLVADMRLVVADAEELLKLTATQAGEKVAELRVRAQEHLETAKRKLADAQEAATEKAKAVAYATDDYVHKHPWRSIGIAAGIGLVVGMLIGRR